MAQLQEFVQRYGLAVPLSMDLGALVARVSVMAGARARALWSEDFDVSAGARANLLFLFGLDASAGGAVTAQADAEFRAELMDNFTVCTPTCPPTGPDVDVSAEAWQQTVASGNLTLQPLGLHLAPLADVVDQSQSQLPSDLQGAALTQRLLALTNFIDSLLCDLEPGCQPAQQRPQWAAEAPAILPTGVAHAQPLLLPNAYLFAGGQTGGDRSSATNTVQQYSLDDGGWVTGYNLLSARTAAGSATVPPATLWVCGGANKSADAMASCETSLGRAWAPAPPLNVSRQAHAMVFYHGSLFVLGGYASGGAALASIEQLDLSAAPPAAWRTAPATLPQPAAAMAALVVPSMDRVLLVGGLDTNGNVLDQLLAFDGKLVTAMPMRLPQPRAFARLALWGPSRVLVLTGQVATSMSVDKKRKQQEREKFAIAAKSKSNQATATATSSGWPISLLLFNK